jgi:hypothetical protein
VDQADKLILKLLTKDELLLRCVYEIKTKELLQNELNIQKQISTAWHEDSSRADSEIRRWRGLYENANANKEEQEKQTKREARKKKFWKTVAMIEAGAGIAITTLLLIRG